MRAAPAFLGFLPLKDRPYMLMAAYPKVKKALKSRGFLPSTSCLRLRYNRIVRDFST
jgi:hypothetical protein